MERRSGPRRALKQRACPSYSCSHPSFVLTSTTVLLVTAATREPDWFYSSLAQVTAAIVGLAGAFLIQRLLSERERIGEIREGVRKSARGLLGRIEAVRDSAATGHESIEKIRREAKEQTAPWSSLSHLYLLSEDGSASGQVGLSEPESRAEEAELARAAGVLREVQTSAEEFTWERLTEDLRIEGTLHIPGPEWLTDWAFRRKAAETALGGGIWERIAQQDLVASLTWQRLVDESLRVNEELEDLRGRGIPRTLYFLVAMLSALFVVGVIAPLAYLNALPGLSKVVLLALSSALVVGFLGFFWNELRRLRRTDRLENAEF
jgi:hypothetical protein